MLEALGDAKGLAWVPDWPGDARMDWIALPSGREHCFTKIQGSKIYSKAVVIWRFCALLSIKQLLDSRNFPFRTAWLETLVGNC